MLLSATRPAAYSELPLANRFHTSTMAMQRAIPTRIRPTMYRPQRSSGPSIAGAMKPKNTTASRNISTGPTSQFCTSDRPITLQSENTFGNSSYFTFASGGYIIRIKPTAMSRLVCSPTVSAALKRATPLGNR